MSPSPDDMEKLKPTAEAPSPPGRRYPFGWSTKTMTRIAGVFIVALGLWTWLVAGLQWKEVRRQLNWLPASATVESSRVRSSMVKGNAREYYADVTYVYEAAGAQRRGTMTVVVGRMNSLQDQSRTYEKVYYKGRRLEMAYNPTNPGESTLRKETGTDLWKGTLGGLAIVVFGVFLWRAARHQKD